MRHPPPDFILAGAPKCGTTAIYKTLQLHKDLYLPGIKEPHYFAFEYSGRRPVVSLEAYDRLYRNAAESQLRGDGSVMYLSSEEAIPAIVRRCPEVKAIASVRNPIDMFISWHNQCVKNLDEDLLEPELAWRAQADRAAGKRLSGLCHDPRALQYRIICSVGAQVRRLFEIVPPQQRLVLVYEDLQENPRISYKRIVDFLGVHDDGRADFLRENVYSRPKSITAARLTRSVREHPFLKNIRSQLKPFLNRHGIYAVEWLFARNLKPVDKPALSEDFRMELIGEFRDDIALLEELLERDFSDWRKSGKLDAQAEQSVYQSRG